MERFLRKNLLADPKHGPVYILKADVADGFYRLHLNINGIQKLAVVFPSPDGVHHYIALPLVLPMGWTSSPPVFSAVTETIADLANRHIIADQRNPWRQLPPHPLSERASKIILPTNSSKTTIPNIPRDPHLPLHHLH